MDLKCMTATNCRKTKKIYTACMIHWMYCFYILRFTYWSLSSGPWITEELLVKMLVNSLRPRRNGRYNADDIFKCIFLKENIWIPTKISLKFVAKGPINNIPALVQIMAWRRPGDKPLSEPMMVSLLTHICVTRPQWVLNGQGFVLIGLVCSCDARQS